MNVQATFPFVIKVCGITNVNDAVVAVEAGANAIGLNFYAKSPRSISLEEAQGIARMLPDTVLKVGVFVEPELEAVQRMVEQTPLDVVQLHGKRVPSVFHRTWRALAATTADPIESLLAEAILLDSFSPDFGGSGLTFDWSLATRFWQPIIIAGGLDASNVADAIEISRPAGVDACSRLESVPGRKDPSKVRAFVCAAQAAFGRLGPSVPKEILS